MYNIYIMIDLILMAGVPHLNLSNFVFLLIYYFQVLSSSANKWQQNSNASCNLYSTNYDCFLVDPWHLHLIFVTFCLSVLNNSSKQKTE